MKQKELMEDIRRQQPFGLLRKLMGSDEIELANSLVARGLLRKGVSDDRQKTVQYSLTEAGLEIVAE